MNHGGYKMTNTRPFKLSEEFLSFSRRLQKNRVKADIDEETIGHPRTSKIISKYFKLNNDRYLELVQLAEDKND